MLSRARPTAVLMALGLAIPAIAGGQSPFQLASTPNGAPRSERTFTFGPALLSVREMEGDQILLRAREADQVVELRVSREVLSPWVSKGEVMLLLVGKIEPLPALRSGMSTLELIALTEFGTPRYELRARQRERRQEVSTELTFAEATELMSVLRVLAPPIDPPKALTAVDRAVLPKSGNRPPVYPAALRSRGTGGEVVVRIIVDTTGRVEKESIEVVRGSDPHLVRAVKETVSGWRFEPAEAGGKKVRQVVELPFVFAAQR